MPGAIARDSPRKSGGRRRVVAERDVAQLHAVVARHERLRRLGIAHERRIEQQRGELRGVGQGALERAVDAVELPHHAGDRHVVAEGQEHRLEAGAGRAVNGQRHAQPHGVREHVHRRRHQVDPQVLVVPRAQGLGAEVAHVAGVDARLVGLHGKRPHGVGVAERVGDVPGQHVRRGLAHFHQPLPPPDERQHQGHGETEHAEEHRHEHRGVAPQHHAHEGEGNQVGRHREAQHVEHVFEAPRIPQGALGERAGEVVVEERHVLGQQLFHRFDVERFHGADLGARQQEPGQAPQRLARDPQAGERQHVGHELRRGRRRALRELSQQASHDERRPIEQERVADAGQQQRRNGRGRAADDLRGVAGENETQRLGKAVGVGGHSLTIVARSEVAWPHHELDETARLGRTGHAAAHDRARRARAQRAGAARARGQGERLRRGARPGATRHPRHAARGTGARHVGGSGCGDDAHTGRSHRGGLRHRPLQHLGHRQEGSRQRRVDSGGRARPRHAHRSGLWPRRHSARRARRGRDPRELPAAVPRRRLPHGPARGHGARHRHRAAERDGHRPSSARPTPRRRATRARRGA